MENFFLEGGWGMYPTALLGFALNAAAVMTVLHPRRFWVVTGTLGLGTLASGVMATLIAISATLKYAARVEQPQDFPLLIAGGLSESLNNSILALMLFIPAAIACAVAAFRSPRTQPVS